MAKGITADIAKALVEAAKETDKTFPKKVQEEIKKEYKSIIKEWYQSYSPSSYKRHYRLTDVFSTKLRKSILNYYFHTDDIDYGSSGLNDYIFGLTIMNGWHGGADKGYKHPNPGTPWYKNPKANTWLRPATQTFSPYERMMDYLNSNTGNWQQEMYDTLMKNINRRL